MQTRPIFYDVLEQPATTFVALINVCIFVYLNSKNIDYPHVGYSYQKVVVENEWWRCISASFSHLSIMHIAFNLYSLWSLGFIEKHIGLIEYFKITYLLVLLSMLCVTAMYHVLIFRFSRESYRTSMAIGFSCVVFGWMTIVAAMQTHSFLNFFGVRIPVVIAPFGSLIFTSLLIPQASFIGHLAGIIIGLIYAIGLLSFVDTYMFLNLLLLTVIFAVINVKMTVPSLLPFIRIENVNDHPAPTTPLIENGVVRHVPIPDIV